MKKTMIAAMMMAASVAVQAEPFTPKNNYGWTHGAMAAGVMLGTTYVMPEATPYVAVATCGYFIHRELQGPGNLFGYPDEKRYKNYSDADRIADWTVPCAVAAGFTYWETKYGVWKPYVNQDGAGAYFQMEID